jgi:sulfatase maturation enzyme AslB (radical SAM superfamily)
MQVPLFNAICADTISACNRRCWFCMYGTERWKKRQFRIQPALMSMEHVTQLLEELSALNFKGRVSWYRINEPMLDKRIVEIYRQTNQVLPDTFKSMITNGDLLTPKKYSALFEAGMGEISISVYEDSGFVHFLRLKEYAQSCGLPVPILKDRRQTESFVTNRAGAIQSLAGRVLEGPCARPYTMLNLTAGGDAVICCCDMFGDEIVGNVFETSLLEVWHGPVFEHYRDRLANSRRAALPLCSRCNYRGWGHKVRDIDPNIAPDAFVHLSKERTSLAPP